MKNYEAYKLTFGMKVDMSSCPTSSCLVCPINEICNHGTDPDDACMDWWNREYKNPELEVNDDGDNKG